MKRQFLLMIAMLGFGASTAILVYGIRREHSMAMSLGAAGMACFAVLVGDAAGA